MKVLIVGLGSIATKHVAAIKAHYPMTKFYALRSSNKADKKEDVTNIFSLAELDNIVIDFAIISNPTAAHASTIKSLIPKSIPLFIEKPLFSNLGNSEVLEEIQKNSIPTYVACNLRFLESLQFAKQYIKDKRINEVNIYCGSYLPDWRPKTNYRTTYSANKELGGGVHIDLIHEIDYAYWLFGMPEKVNKTFTSRSSLDISAYDYANYTLGFQDFNVSIILNYFRRDAKRTLEIVMEEETLLVNLLENKVYCNQDVVFESNKAIIDTYESQIQFFINEVVLNRIEFNTADEAYKILEICLRND